MVIISKHTNFFPRQCEIFEKNFIEFKVVNFSNTIWGNYCNIIFNEYFAIVEHYLGIGAPHEGQKSESVTMASQTIQVWEKGNVIQVIIHDKGPEG